jgi:hypothetical protein
VKPKRIRYKPLPLTGSMSMTPAVFATPDMVKQLNRVLRAMPDRVERGKQLMLLEAAFGMLRDVQAKAPTLDVIGDYAKDLEVVLVSGVSEEQGVAILYRNKPRQLSAADDASSTLLIVKARRTSEPWVSVLSRYQPWPVFMLPLMPAKTDAQLIARRATPSEVADARDRIMVNRRAIESQLHQYGLPDAKVQTDASKVNDREVYDDVSYMVQRLEFGYGGKQDAHWRPALKGVANESLTLGRKFVEYVETGNESVFDVGRYTDVALQELQGYDTALQSRIAK